MPSASIRPPALVRSQSSWSIAGAHYKHWATSLSNFGVTPFFGGKSSRLTFSHAVQIPISFFGLIWISWFSYFRKTVCVLLCFIDQRVRKIRNEASSCPDIFSRTLRFYYVASSPGSVFLSKRQKFWHQFLGKLTFEQHFRLLHLSFLPARVQRQFSAKVLCHPWHLICTLYTPKERLPSGVPRGKIWRMIFEKTSSVRGGTNIQSTPSAAARGGKAWRRNVRIPVYSSLLLPLSLTQDYIQTLSKTLPNIPWYISQKIRWKTGTAKKRQPATSKSRGVSTMEIGALMKRCQSDGNSEWVLPTCMYGTGCKGSLLHRQFCSDLSGQKNA